jgi:hypothetical protein
LSDEHNKPINLILPASFGGKVSNASGMDGQEIIFREKVKTFVYKLASEMEIDINNVVVGLIPISFEVCLETINPDLYDEALESYHEFWHEFLEGVTSQQVKQAVINLKKAEDEAIANYNSGMDWS